MAPGGDHVPTPDAEVISNEQKATVRKSTRRACARCPRSARSVHFPSFCSGLSRGPDEDISDNYDRTRPESRVGRRTVTRGSLIEPGRPDERRCPPARACDRCKYTRQNRRFPGQQTRTGVPSWTSAPVCDFAHIHYRGGSPVTPGSRGVRVLPKTVSAMARALDIECLLSRSTVGLASKWTLTRLLIPGGCAPPPNGTTQAGWC